MSRLAKKRVGVLISGRGSNMQSLVKATNSAEFSAEVVTVIANRADAAGLAWARDNGIEAIAIDHKASASRAAFDDQIHAALTQSDVEIVALAGFMRILTPEFVARWQGRMINVHPSLLPLFPGLHTHARAIEAGMKIAGCTVHFVTKEMDVGPIIAQAVVPIVAGDTADSLADRVLKAEHQIYPQALQWVANGNVTFENTEFRERTRQFDEQLLLSPRQTCVLPPPC